MSFCTETLESAMNLGLRSKTAVVSGSTAGIGLAIATALAAEGASVIINGRTEPRVAAALEKIRGAVAGAQARGVAADLGTWDGVETFLNDAPEADILVNNLGIFEVKPFAEITDADWLRFFAVNVLSGVRLARHYLPGMRDKNWGRVIFISSESAVNIPVEMIHYGMTKTAQVAVARGLAESVAGTGITVNSILVGPTASEGSGNFLHEVARQQGVTLAQVEKEFFENVRPSSLLKRFEKPEEVAAVVAFVASAQGAIINGAALRAEGGVLRSAL
jgi:NAD(P)-dependent dehydrogenase (short-subunit alcohol dehydrogenase family)